MAASTLNERLSRGEWPAPRGFFRTAVEWPYEIKRDSLDVSRLFPLEGPHGDAFELARAGERSDAAVRELRDGAVQGRVPWQGKAPVPEGGEFATGAARRRQAQRSGERRLHRAPPYVLRNARQLLVRRLFQAGRPALCVGAAHQGVQAPALAVVGHRLSHRR